MWQRIQTLYLAVSTALLFILFFSDACTVVKPEGMQYVTYLQLQKPYFGILLGIDRPATERSIPSICVLRHEAQQAFRDWRLKVDKVEY